MKDLIVQAGEKSENSSKALLHPSAILGNIFLFMFAGHEASANTIHFILLLLACNPWLQKSLQTDIDCILGELPVNKWSYDFHFKPLMESHLGAVVNEALRLYTVLPFILKATAEQFQSIVVGGHTHVIPANTLILINTSATHRNPRYWPEPHGCLTAVKPDPVAAFNPSHWLGRAGTNTGALLTPCPGSFIPFSGGSRGCLGNQFSLVEICAVLARLFKYFSVELAVEGLTPNSSEQDKKSGWQESKRRAETAMASDVVFRMSLRMEGKVPVYFVKRGDEIFAK